LRLSNGIHGRTAAWGECCAAADVVALTEIKGIAHAVAASNVPGEGTQMQILLFTLLAVVLYVAADRMLDACERRAGRRFEYRSAYFFVILLVLAVIAFSAVQRFAAGN
jgi:hypothetical protein